MVEENRGSKSASLVIVGPAALRARSLGLHAASGSSIGGYNCRIGPSSAADPRIRQIEDLWTAYRSRGTEGIRELVDDDVEWLPYGAGGETLRGFDELAAYLANRVQSIDASTYSYEPRGDAIIVSGHLRVRDGLAMTDVQLWWIYRFRGEKLVRFEAYANRAAAYDSLPD
jgi:ketosteroid isomerase-like protein